MKDRSHLTLCLAGDVMIGRGVDQIFEPHCSPTLYEPFVTDARSYVALAEERNGPVPQPASDTYIWGDALHDMHGEHPQLRILNLETSLTTSDHYWVGKGIHYRAHPARTGLLKSGQWDCCTLANNHVLDWGREGLRETLATLKSASIRWTGAGLTDRDAAAPATFQLGETRLHVFGLGSIRGGIPLSWQVTQDQPGICILESTPRSILIDRMLESKKKPGALSIVSIHWGDNWGTTVPLEQRMLAHDFIDQGQVAIVHFHSSHHPKSIEIFHNKLILYGAGDLINDYEGIAGYEEFHPEWGLLYFPRIDPATGSLIHLTIKAFIRRRMRLARASDAETEEIRKELVEQSQSCGTIITHQKHNTLFLTAT